MDAARARKLADRISQIVAEMLERRIKDPRLGFATVTEARLTNDLREATVFYTGYGSRQEQPDRRGNARAADQGPQARLRHRHRSPADQRPSRGHRVLHGVRL